MFLATTALREFWDTEQEILFLGSWCTRYDRRSDWQGLRYQVMPSPWDDRDAFHKACRYVEGCYTRILDQLVGYLNSVHGVPFEKRYWRITVGPWLLWYLHTAYDRYVHVNQALKSYPGLETFGLAAAAFATPHDMPEFVREFVDDRFHLQLVSQIFAEMGFPFATRPVPQAVQRESKSVGSRNLSLSRLATRLINRVWPSVAGLIEMQWSRALLLQLARASWLKAMPIDWVDDSECPTAAPMIEARQGFADLSAVDEFEKIFLHTFPVQFPTHYLECFARVRQQIVRNLKQLPGTIVSSGGWKFNEHFKFAAAEASAQNRRLIACQHGGGYGLMKFSPTEVEEIAVADEYFAWGWANGPSSGLKNLPSPALSALKEISVSRDVQSPKDVGLVTTDHPRYLYLFHSVPVGAQWEDYGDWQARFIGSLPESLQGVLTFRPYTVDYGHGLTSRVRDRFPLVKIDRTKSIENVFTTSRVVVIDHPMTTMLESLVINTPTLLFWDDRLWETREEAAGFIEQIRSAEILWHSPELAAAKLNEIYEDPWSWWGSKKVQDARVAFVDRYAAADANWAACWTRALTGKGIDDTTRRSARQ